MAVGPALPETSLTLDNNILTAWRYQKRTIIEEITAYQSRLKVIPALTSMVVYEALYGFENKSVKDGESTELTKQDRAKTEQLINVCIVLPFDKASAAIAVYVIPRLPKNIPQGLRRDVFIAATALAHGYGVATNNRRDFELIGNYMPEHVIRNSET